MSKFSGNMAELGLRKSQRDDRADAEAVGTGKVDGRALRRKGRTEQMAFRFTKERRQQIERLAIALNKPFVEVVEEALDLLEKRAKGR